MDHTTFDTVTRTIGSLESAVSRRSALRGLVAGALAVTAGSAAQQADARSKTGKQGKGKSAKRRRPGEFCKTDKQCRRVDGDYLCGRQTIFAEERVCCGGIDALCDETGASGRRCCYGYLCAGGRCIVV